MNEFRIGRVDFSQMFEKEWLNTVLEYEET